ncbi:hypothetical protein AMTRI_Chr04g250840 [Amborella trichopoda]|uniref:Uncharacterized protein n=1 Tax=Amborella trichopoda TaxID=13333 RepID=W1NF49_AMBTC|nr:COMM domain-containing protein 2 [Amborella trichopoda]ERM94073.1 hypothetical protein AMTR_s00010p00090410 [Amborella trichopoda]|eukprot:XP_006826836.1 COMM domain-containing protein 2 [Amborella trichopoda]
MSSDPVVPRGARFLLSSPPSVALDFVDKAIDIILTGKSTKRGYKRAANALQVTVESVEEAIQMLCKIFFFGAQSNLSNVDMAEFLLKLEFDKASAQCLASHFSQKAKEIRDIVVSPLLYAPSFKNIEWRLDIQVAGRSFWNQMYPSFLLKLLFKPQHVNEIQRPIASSSCEKPSRQPSEIYVEANYSTLKAICTDLEKALASRGDHSRWFISNQP